MPPDTSGSFDILFEIAKIGVSGLIGFGAKWGIGSVSSKSKDTKAALSMLSDLTRRAENAMRMIMGSTPDPALSYSVATDRTTLSNLISSAFGSDADYVRINNAFSIYGPSLRFADPLLGGASEARIHEMRSAEINLRSAITRAAEKRLSWHLTKHDK